MTCRTCEEARRRMLALYDRMAAAVRHSVKQQRDEQQRDASVGRRDGARVIPRDRRRD